MPGRHHARSDRRQNGKRSSSHHLNEEVHRFAELRRLIPGITQKVLTQQLRELERDGIVHRKVYAQVPPKVEYALSDYGKTLRPVLQAMCHWGEAHEERRAQSTTARAALEEA